MDYLILALATFRISSLATGEDGPYEILLHTRNWLQKTISAELLSCIWCFSIWVGIALTIAYWYMPYYTVLICLPLALSTAAIAIDKLTD